MATKAEFIKVVREIVEEELAKIMLETSSNVFRKVLAGGTVIE